ncbi:imidazole glycerol phosphate synthase, cyclase subunit HisF [Sulfurimonas gotlandica GD1]|uniref:imidazole glycerol-phosphate synthase n=1 Tax=Sulfurimonas gotlandica (strain DSM 19862 / JCM 16533 / GD1) TaxID=929558 RepID=B6BGE0_SULGG|nr:imidazole glycerol phosphate synthase cyclase subunit [Sulfurimonas gotlandica]EDZ62872.1 imidazole glycerol phosphate synthase, cyclase subunit HisF [Sulfurimonas gotlandica GD1]EHP29567.1 imidazole glycerol phosphate synthase, cyclase subunit HisF [Sulfurimonas gotlandica GD1]
MKKIRVIARIDIKNEHTIKGIHLEGLRKVGNPNEMALRYYEDGIDEIVLMDAVASLYDRNSLKDVIVKACEDIFIPITVGGGLRNLQDIQEALNSGADKVAINTQAIREPSFITTASKQFGSQCIISSIVAKKIDDGKWEAYIENGREPTGVDVLAWAKEVQELGAGEIMLTSIDKEGTKKGFDLELNKAVAELVNIPVISSGGAGSTKDIVHLCESSDIDAVAIASILHYKLESVSEIKKTLINNKIKVRIDA